MKLILISVGKNNHGDLLSQYLLLGGCFTSDRKRYVIGGWAWACCYVTDVQRYIFKSIFLHGPLMPVRLFIHYCSSYTIFDTANYHKFIAKTYYELSVCQELKLKLCEVQNFWCRNLFVINVIQDMTSKAV